MAVNIATILMPAVAWDREKLVETIWHGNDTKRTQQRVFIARATNIAKLQIQHAAAWNDVPNMWVEHARATAFQNMIALSFPDNHHRNVLTQNAD